MRHGHLAGETAIGDRDGRTAGVGGGILRGRRERRCGAGAAASRRNGQPCLADLGEKADKWIAIVRNLDKFACMNSNAVKLQVRMERSLKEEAEEVFAEMGLDTTTAVRIFFTKVAKTRSIPFLLKAEPEFTPEQEARILEAWEESKDPANLSGPFSSVEKLFKHLDEEVAKHEKAEKRVTKSA